MHRVGRAAVRRVNSRQGIQPLSICNEGGLQIVITLLSEEHVCRHWRKAVHKVPRREWARRQLVGASGSCGQLSGAGGRVDETQTIRTYILQIASSSGSASTQMLSVWEESATPGAVNIGVGAVRAWVGSAGRDCGLLSIQWRV